MTLLRFSNIEYDKNWIALSTSADRFLAVPSASSSPGTDGSASKIVSLPLNDIKPSVRWDKIWNWITAGLNHRYGCITPAVSQASETFWAICKALAQADPPCVPASCFGISDHAQFFSFQPLCLKNLLNENKPVPQTLSAQSFYTVSVPSPGFSWAPTARIAHC